MSARGWIAVAAALLLGFVLALPHLRDTYLGRLFNECSGGIKGPECPVQIPPAAAQSGFIFPHRGPPAPGLH
jgi:hypothetical protein